MRKIFHLILLCSAWNATAQTTYLPLGNDDYFLIERMETLSGNLSSEVFTGTKPYSRKAIVSFSENLLNRGDSLSLSAIDQYNFQHLISSSGEWAQEGNGAIDSKRPWFNTFYKKQPDFIHVNKDNFFLSANPVISFRGYSESYEGGSETGFESSRGVEIRGRIADKVGFYTYVTDNQEQPVSYAARWMNERQAVAGADYYQQSPGSRTLDYLQARGYIDFAAVKDHINVTFGYDKHMYGDGIRSLFLSDFAANGAFLRLNTRIWKLNYQNLYLELTPQYIRGGDRRLGHKYATIHQLSINATKWLNIGLFEGVVFARPDRYEFSYLVPIIFYRQVERALGSPDNALLGINFKAIAAKRFQLYGQLMLDEFKFKELTAGNGWWANKFGIQAGAKYFDAFGIRNLDLQGEINLVRPFTYSHGDSMANYTHYNQPLAHPLGSGFAEVLGLVRYQPIKKMTLTLRGMYYQKGVDTGNVNFGNDIFRPNNNGLISEYGYELISGVSSQTLSANFQASYELKENLFIDLGLTHRRRSYDRLFPSEQSTWFTAGFRLNIAKRDWDFY